MASGQVDVTLRHRSKPSSPSSVQSHNQYTPQPIHMNPDMTVAINDQNRPPLPVGLPANTDSCHNLQQTRPLPETPQSKTIQQHQHAILQENSVELKQHLNFNGTYVLDQMEQDGVLTATDVENIKLCDTRKDQVTKLLQIVKSKGTKAFDCFVSSLGHDFKHYQDILSPCKSEVLLATYQNPAPATPMEGSERQEELAGTSSSSEEESEEDPYNIPDKVLDEYDTPHFTKCPDRHLNVYEENPSYILKKNVTALQVKEECTQEFNDALNRLKFNQRPCSSASGKTPNTENEYDVLPEVTQATNLSNETTISNENQSLENEELNTNVQGPANQCADSCEVSCQNDTSAATEDCATATATGDVGLHMLLSPFLEPDKLPLAAGTTVIFCSKFTNTLWEATGNKKYSFVYTVSNSLALVQSNEIKKVGDPKGETWYFPVSVTSAQMEKLLGQKKQRGTFYIYQSTKSSTAVPYNLSVSTTDAGDVKHYHIHRNENNELYIKYEQEFGIKFQNIQELVDYFRFNRGRLGCRLRWSPSELENYKPNFPPAKKCHEDRLTVFIGTNLGDFKKRTGESNVYKASYNNRDYVAKTPSTFPLNFVDEDDFLSEARILDQIRHENIRKLIAVCYKDSVPYLILEDGGTSDLLQYLRQSKMQQDVKLVMECFLQILSALTYLANRKFVIHRDISARNCLVQSNEIMGIKVQLSDFGMAVKVIQYDEYYSDDDERFCHRWAAPEVLRDRKFSTKSDMWAAAVLFWEMASGGKMPYENLKTNQEVRAAVMKQSLLPMPGSHPVYKKVYKQCLKECWNLKPEDRPSASRLAHECRTILGSECEGGLHDPLYDVHTYSSQSLTKSSSRFSVKRFFKKNK